MSSVFYNCVSLHALDLSNFDITKITNIGSMFMGCTNLQSLNIANFDTSHLDSSNNINVLKFCNSLNFINIYNYKGYDIFSSILSGRFSSLTVCAKSLFPGTLTTNNVRISCEIDFIIKENLGRIITVTFNIEDDSGKSVKFLNPEKNADYVYIDNDTSINQKNNNPINLSKGEHTVIMIWENKLTSLYRMFADCSDIISIDFSKCDTSEVTGMSVAFYRCSNLLSIDLTNFNTEKVNNMGGMFNGCKKLQSLDFSGWDTSNVEKFDTMFNGCESLVSLDLSNFNTSKGFKIHQIFLNCKSLEFVDISNFDLTNMNIAMTEVFQNCNSLKYINLLNFKEKEGEDIFASIPENCFSENLVICYPHELTGALNNENIINNCPLNTVITVTFNISEEDDGKSFRYIYSENNENYKALDSLDSVYIDGDLSKNEFNGENTHITLSKGVHIVTMAFKNNEIAGLFKECSDIISIDFSKFDTTGISEMYNFFDSCTKLESLDLSNFNTEHLVNMESMFKNCISLQSLDLSNFDTSNVRNFNYLFKGCSSLKVLDISNFNTDKISPYDNNIFSGCSSLYFMNLYNYEGKDIFTDIESYDNLTYCAKAEIEGTLKNNHVRISCIIPNPVLNPIPIKCYNYTIESIDQDLCISCNFDYFPKINDNFSIFPYINCYKEVEGYYLDVDIFRPCYSTCKNCKENGDENHHHCSECIEDYIFIDEKGHENNCYKKCPYKYYVNETNQYKCINEEIINKTKDEIINDLNSLITDKDLKETYFINGDNYTVVIKPVDDYIKDSTVNIDFRECSNLLKKQYGSDDFIMVQINMKNPNKNCLNDIVEYKIYNQNGDNIELSSCKALTIPIECKISENSLVNKQKISNFQHLGVDIFNINDDFFNDICFPFSDDSSASDVILTDRVSDIFLNYSLCFYSKN